MTKIAFFPGSFDPFTIGHEYIVRRSLSLFDKIVIGIGINNTKSEFISVETRKKIINKVFTNEKNISVVTYSGLTVDYCIKNNYKFILRGLRTSADFEFERAIGQTNKLLVNDVETIFMLTLPEHSFISSSIVRDVFKNNGNLAGFLPSNITREDFL